MLLILEILIIAIIKIQKRRNKRKPMHRLKRSNRKKWEISNGEEHHNKMDNSNMVIFSMLSQNQRVRICQNQDHLNKIVILTISQILSWCNNWTNYAHQAVTSISRICSTFQESITWSLPSKLKHNVQHCNKWDWSMVSLLKIAMFSYLGHAKSIEDYFRIT